MEVDLFRNRLEKFSSGEGRVVGMQFKKALIGALVGGVIGVGVLVAAFFLFGVQHTSLALVIAVLVGLGVRMMVSTKGHASYLRGALTALIAVAAFVGGSFLVAQLARSQMAANASRPSRVAAPPQQDDRTTNDEAAMEQDQEPVAEEVEDLASRGADRIGTLMRTPIKPGYSTWDFVWFSVAMLVAYELGRGTGAATAAAATSDAPETPATPA
jgi:hypothetical protein